MNNQRMSNIKRFLCIFILMLSIFILVGCGSKPSKDLWNKYVKAVNKQDLSAVADCFAETDADKEKFMQEHADYFDGLSKLKTTSYEETISCSFSNSMNTQAYYLGEVEVLANDSTTHNLKIYVYENNKGIFFCSYFKVEEGSNGNEPNAYWKDKVYYHTDEFLYKNLESGTVFVEQITNAREYVVPAEVDGNAITTIGEYAFYKYNKILSFTIPTSRLRKVVISEGITTIGKYAFYQCEKLRSVVIPESMRYIDRMAFANCSRLERLEFQARTKESGSVLEIASIPTGEQGGNQLVITGAHNLQTGEISYLGAEFGTNKVPRVEWSTKSEIIDLDSATGKVVAKKAGHATITATLVENKAILAEVSIEITDIAQTDCLKMYWDVFSRCPNLKEIYLHAYNPNTYVIDSGTTWLFNSTCKIYVPKGSRDMYINHSLWSKYADQIVEMKEDDIDNTIDIALESVSLTKETAGDIYYAVNPNKVDNIIYLIQSGADYKLVNAYVGSVLFENKEATPINSDANKEALFKLLSGLASELSISLDESEIAKADPLSDEGKAIDKVLDAILVEGKKINSALTKAQIELDSLSIAKNELNEGVVIYSVDYRFTDGSDAGEMKSVFVERNNTLELVTSDYAGLYDLVKIIMASGRKVEK